MCCTTLPERSLAFCLLAFLLVTVSSAQGQTVPPQSSSSLTFKVQAAAERMEITVNASRILEMPFKVPRLYVGNPDLLKANPLSPNQIQITALKPGVTQVNLWDEDERITTVDVIIYGDARELELLLRSEFPDAQLKIRPLASSVYLSGFVAKAEQVGQIVRMAEDYYPKVVNNITVGGVQQILLNVRVLEISRTKLRSMGVDWSNINGNFFITQRSNDIISSIDQNTGLPLALAQGGGKDTVRFGIVNGVDHFYGFLDLLRQNDLARLLAEPKLITVSGRPASFNVGGQIPIPVAQSLGTVTVVYRDFGTQVDFVPVVLGNGNIRLEVRPDITEIDPSLRDATTGVPGFRRRYADTAVEMQAGQTMAVAGLIYQRTDTTNKGVPWLADLPWVGAAFRRVKEVKNEVELVITVTPEFVEAMDPCDVPPCGPGEMTTGPNDTELYWRGYMEVPKCCTDGNCSKCRSEKPSHGQIAPTSATYPTSQRSMQQPTARMTQPSPTANRPAASMVSTNGGTFASISDAEPAPVMVEQGTPAAPVSTGRPAQRKWASNYGGAGSNGSASGEPALIGPLGYDRLK